MSQRNDWGYLPGELNPIGGYVSRVSEEQEDKLIGTIPKATRVSEDVDCEKYDTFYLIRRSLLNIEEGDQVKGTGPYRAVALKVIEPPQKEKSDTTGDPIEWGVRARIPELHIAIPVPSNSEDLMAINCYPIFTPRTSQAASEKPAPGNIIIVDFGNRENMEDGQYLGIYNKKTNSPRKAENRGVCGGELPNLFNSLDNKISTLGESKIPKKGEVYFTTGYLKGKPKDIELIEWGGKFVSLEMAVCLDNLKILADQSAVIINVVSGFRTMEEQTEKYRRWKLPKEDPEHFETKGVAPPGWSNHQMGNAVDLQIGGLDGKKMENQYEWLAKNAPQVGLKTIYNPYEPWHWEILQG